MSTYTNLNNEPELLKKETRYDGIKNSKYQTEKHDPENILKSLKIYKEYIEIKYKSLNKKKVIIIITEFLFGRASTISSSTMGLINPGAGINIPSSTALLTSIALLITKEYIWKLKRRYTKLGNWTNVIAILYEKASMVDEKIDEKDAGE